MVVDGSAVAASDRFHTALIPQFWGTKLYEVLTLNESIFLDPVLDPCREILSNLQRPVQVAGVLCLPGDPHKIVDVEAHTDRRRIEPVEAALSKRTLPPRPIPPKSKVSTGPGKGKNPSLCSKLTILNFTHALYPPPGATKDQPPTLCPGWTPKRGRRELWGSLAGWIIVAMLPQAWHKRPHTFRARCGARTTMRMVMLLINSWPPFSPLSLSWSPSDPWRPGKKTRKTR